MNSIIQTCIKMLKETRETTRAKLKNVDINIVAHPDSGWRIKDVLLHLSWVDNEARRILDAFNNDQVYKMPDEWMVRDINDKLYEEMKHYSDERTMLHFNDGFSELLFAYQRLQESKLSDAIHVPWGEDYDLERFTQMTVDHETQHRNEIIEAINRERIKP